MRQEASTGRLLLRVIELSAASEIESEVVVFLRGELDLASVGEVERTLESAGASARVSLVLDCRELAFLDASVLGAIARYRRSRPEVPLEFRATSPFITRVIGIVRWSDLLSA